MLTGIMVGQNLFLSLTKVLRLQLICFRKILIQVTAPLQIVTDNGTKNSNQLKKHTLEILNTSNITTSFYHTQGNVMVERFHRSLHDIRPKKVGKCLGTWDLHLNQVLSVIRLNMNESTNPQTSLLSIFYIIMTQ